jgi:hypothetical protein
VVTRATLPELCPIVERDVVIATAICSIRARSDRVDLVGVEGGQSHPPNGPKEPRNPLLALEPLAQPQSL